MSERDDFLQCPHEAIRATCGAGGCNCPCDPCAPSRPAPEATDLTPGEVRLSEDEWKSIRAALRVQQAIAPDAEMVYVAVERIVAARPAARDAEVEALKRDLAHEREHNKYLETELDADAKHAALKPGESCDVCTHLESEQVQQWMAADLDWQARAEAAEAEVADLRAKVERVEALADEWADPQYGFEQEYTTDLRAALGGSDGK